ncbi:MAG: hypothetical protein BWZ07_02743 [Alphaproteobacteria bacterium ADurb.BinA280]|nr:MAG: hypothetical protein BWZ07_02743 [Alphaproteobacteria bacterium ADurb.BinA280]
MTDIDGHRTISLGVLAILPERTLKTADQKDQYGCIFEPGLVRHTTCGQVTSLLTRQSTQWLQRMRHAVVVVQTRRQAGHVLRQHEGFHRMQATSRRHELFQRVQSRHFCLGLHAVDMTQHAGEILQGKRTRSIKIAAGAALLQ